MRKLLFIFISLACIVGCGGKNTPLNGEFTISGTINTANAKKIIVQMVENGLWVDIQEHELDANSSFKTTVNGEEGIYGIRIFTTGRNYGLPYIAKFYAKKGDKISIKADKLLSNYEFSDEITQENKIVHEWALLYDKMFSSRHTYKTLYPEVKQFTLSKDKLVSSINTDNKIFNDLMPFIINTEYRYGFINFKNMPNSIHPTKEEIHPIYNEVYSFDFADGRYLKTPYMDRLISSSSRMFEYEEMKNSEFGVNGFILDKIKNDVLKGSYFQVLVPQYRSYETFMSDYQRYGKYLVTKSQKSIAEKFITVNKRLSKGQPAIDFTYPDKESNMVSLSDFKGKVVLVDVWATWCKPCLNELPSLHKLEEEFKDNKEMVFIAISVDEAKDKNAWKKMITDKKMGGVQLFASGWGDLAKNYKITGIPRFMLFDKEGNIASSNAPRPSDPKLKEMIQQLLIK